MQTPTKKSSLSSASPSPSPSAPSISIPCKNGESKSFTKEKHIQYFVHCLKRLPRQYIHLDTNRITLVHFAVQALDILGFFDDEEEEVNLKEYNVNKNHIIEWIYSLQIIICHSRKSTFSRNNIFKDEERGNVHHYTRGGFQGGTFLNLLSNSNQCTDYDIKIMMYKQGHLATTYTALCTLITLGDDLTKVDKTSIIHSIKALQQPDGSFIATESGGENDLRFLYCACAISYLLNDWSGVDKQKAVSYIWSCRSFDGAFGLIPGQEGHGGSTFCAIASLQLMGELDQDLGGGDSYENSDMWRHELIRWCVFRQLRGIQGRPNKLQDTCYSFWIGACLYILGCKDVLDHNALDEFVLGCQSDLGGFCKLECNIYPDLLHSFYSLAWLSLSQGKVVERKNNSTEKIFVHKLHPSLGIALRHIDKTCVQIS
jgi:geranylgeranyl transferase type-1 subunit beta